LTYEYPQTRMPYRDTHTGMHTHIHIRNTCMHTFRHTYCTCLSMICNTANSANARVCYQLSLCSGFCIDMPNYPPRTIAALCVWWLFGCWCVICNCVCICVCAFDWGCCDCVRVMRHSVNIVRGWSFCVWWLDILGVDVGVMFWGHTILHWQHTSTGGGVALYHAHCFCHLWHAHELTNAKTSGIVWWASCLFEDCFGTVLIRLMQCYSEHVASTPNPSVY